MVTCQSNSYVFIHSNFAVFHLELPNSHDFRRFQENDFISFPKFSNVVSERFDCKKINQQHDFQGFDSCKSTEISLARIEWLRLLIKLF